MIPYFELREIPIGGGHSIATFGVLVVIGIAVGIVFAQTRARTLGIPATEINAAMAWALVAGLVGSHLEVRAALSERSRRSRHLRVLERYERFGGFFGALAGSASTSPANAAPGSSKPTSSSRRWYVGWVFGRLGCTLVHDHVGTRSPTSSSRSAFPAGRGTTSAGTSSSTRCSCCPSRGRAEPAAARARHDDLGDDPALCARALSSGISCGTRISPVPICVTADSRSRSTPASSSLVIAFVVHRATRAAPLRTGLRGAA